MKKYIALMIILLSVLLVGCGELYNIKPDIQDTGNNSTAQPTTEDISNETGNTEDAAINDEEAKKAAAEEAKAAKEKEEQLQAEKEESERLAAEQARNDLIDSLFLNQFSDTKPYTLNVDVNELSNEETGWSFKRNADHLPVTGYYDVDLSLFGSYFIKDTDEKVMYLTFDEGYENGYTPTILDILKENNVKATFFITGQFLKTQPDLVKRMVAEGHIVANHSNTHPSFPTLTDEEIYDELTSVANRFKEVIGQEMAPFFRPPGATYSERTLYLARKLGYRTIFYSMAYGDWDIKNQPGKEAAYEHVLTNYHNGAIILLHAVSQSNTEALDDILKDLIALGYRFGSLYELE